MIKCKKSGWCQKEICCIECAKSPASTNTCDYACETIEKLKNNKNSILQKCKHASLIIPPEIMNDSDRKIISKMCDCSMNISSVAKELFMHRGTIVYHLDKIKKSYGLDARNFYDLIKLKEIADDTKTKNLVESCGLFPGDRVVMNDTYYVTPENKERIFFVKTKPQEVCGIVCVWLEGCHGCYAVDGLTKIKN